MPKHIIEFNLPEEAEELKIMLQAYDMSAFVFDFANYMRDRLKHGELSQEENKVLEKIRTQFWEMAGECGVDL